jgi:hypothetical protein
MAATKRGRPQTPTKVDNRRSKILKILESADLGTNGDAMASEATLEDTESNAINEDVIDGSSTAATLEDTKSSLINGSPDAVAEDMPNPLSIAAVDEGSRSDSPDDVFTQVVG